MRTYTFHVSLGGIEPADEMANRLYEAGCDDGTLVMRSGVTSVVFDRDAPSLEEAIRSAVADVSKAGYPPKGVTIEPEALAAMQP